VARQLPLGPSQDGEISLCTSEFHGLGKGVDGPLALPGAEAQGRNLHERFRSDVHEAPGFPSAVLSLVDLSTGRLHITVVEEHVAPDDSAKNRRPEGGVLVRFYEIPPRPIDGTSARFSQRPPCERIWDRELRARIAQSRYRLRQALDLGFKILSQPFHPGGIHICLA
jgi:hypothetical protein